MAHPANNCTTLAAPGPTATTKPHSTTTKTTTSTTIYNLTKSLSKSANIEPTSIHKTAKRIQRQVLESGYSSKSLVVDVVEERKGKNLGSIPCRNTLGERQPRTSTTTALEKRVERQVLESGYDNKSLVVDVVEERKGQNLGSIPCRNNLGERQSRASISALEKRGSSCDVRVELSDFLLAHCAKVVSVDMPPFLQIHAVGFARKVKDSLEKFSAKTLALSLKKEFDGAYGPAWHCIVGSSFGSFVTHSVGGFLYFSLDQKVYILLFKTTVQRAD